MESIDVCLTVDVEFSLGRTFQGVGNLPIGLDRIYCPIGQEDWGLGRILDTLQQYQLPATFFIEALHVFHFGYEPMAGAVDRILRAGHDVQLHLHPQWLFFRDQDWRRRLPCRPPADNCEGRGEDEILEMIDLGLEAFARWGAPRPIALRTGALRVDRTVYRAMRRRGLYLASNVGLGAFEPIEPELHLAGGRIRVHDVLEVPVLTYRQATFGSLKALRLLTITSTSAEETRALLEQASRSHQSPCIILTHPHEFVRYFDSDKPVSPSRINLRRLIALCRLLGRERDRGAPRWRAVSFRDAAADWAALPEASFPPLQTPPLASVARVLANRANDTLRWI